MHVATPVARGSEVARIMDGLRRAVRALRAGNVDAERTLGVSAAQLFVLRQIGGAPGLSVAELAARTHTAQSSVSEVVARLVSDGLVAKAASEQDRRRATMTLTAQGKSVIRRAGRTVQERLIAGLAELPADDRARLADLVDEWLRAAGLDDVPATMFFEPAARK